MSSIQRFRTRRIPATYAAPVLFGALSATALFAQDVSAQARDGGLELPPPPPEDRPNRAPLTAADAAPAPSDASASVTAVVPTSSGDPARGATALPPPPPGAAPTTRRPSGDARARRRAAVTLRRIEAVVRDQAEIEMTQRRAMGYGLLAGGAVCALAGVIPFVAPPPGTPTYVTIITGTSALALGSVIALFGGLSFLNRSFWEEIEGELQNDPVTDPQDRLAGVISRWNGRIARERSAQRTGGALLIATGVLSAGFAVASYVNPALGGGLGMAFAAPFFAVGAVYIPLGIVTLNERTPSERALRFLRSAQGDPLYVSSRQTVRFNGLAMTPSSVTIAGTF